MFSSLKNFIIAMSLLLTISSQASIGIIILGGGSPVSAIGGMGLVSSLYGVMASEAFCERGSQLSCPMRLKSIGLVLLNDQSPESELTAFLRSRYPYIESELSLLELEEEIMLEARDYLPGVHKLELSKEFVVSFVESLNLSSENKRLLGQDLL